MGLTLAEFVEKYDGKFIDFDGYWGGQCVDLVRQFIKEVLEIPQPPPVVGAYQLWDNYLANYFEQIPNTPTAIPKPNDIVIWNRRYGGGYGHVAVVVGANNTIDGFRSFDQNFPLGSPCHIQEHNYSSVTGWLRPKENMADALEACMADREKFWKERDQALADLAKCEEQCKSLADEIADCKETCDKEKADLQVKIDHLVKTNEALRNDILALKAEIESLKSENPLDGYGGWELIIAGIKKLFGR